ncbi:ribosomal protein L7/L12 [Streptosporangium sp. NPDC002524]|uniref:ribosomal protein L7/L12 n=1 Tax=Streptosporangium sp. NPDC002524 TaxID=3154537 RepID=UPI003320C8F7
MPNIGPTELLILAVLLAVVLAVVIGVVVAAMKGARAVSGGRAPVIPPTPQGLHETVTGLTRRGLKIQAIKELRQYTGLGLKESKMVVDAVAAGHDMWSHPVMAGFRPARPVVPPNAGVPDAPGAPVLTGPDLATRVRGLKAAGRTEQAVHLVRGETGMGEREAELFVDTL